MWYTMSMYTYITFYQLSTAFFCIHLSVGISIISVSLLLWRAPKWTWNTVNYLFNVLILLGCWLILKMVGYSIYLKWSLALDILFHCWYFAWLVFAVVRSTRYSTCWPSPHPLSCKSAPVHIWMGADIYCRQTHGDQGKASLAQNGGNSGCILPENRAGNQHFATWNRVLSREVAEITERLCKSLGTWRFLPS